MNTSFVRFASFRFATVFLASLCFAQSCIQQSGSGVASLSPADLAGTTANLFIIATDASVSAKSYAVQDTDIWQVYEYVATHGGGRMALMQFNANSFYQEPVFIDVPPLDTTSKVEGSSYDRTRRVALNQAEIAKYQAAFQRFTGNFSLKNDHNAQFTDIRGGLELINSILDDQSLNQEVIFVTDFVNDEPPKHGYDPFSPFKFGTSNAQLHFVRPDESTLGMPVDSLFPNALRIKKYASFRQIFFKK
jgi:hypothetical protein